MSVARAERLFFLVVTLAACAYVMLRAVHVPLIHDEANSFWWYVVTGEFIPFHSHENTGNHLLSTFFGWVGHGLFGSAPWALRIGSLLAFPLYAWSCWRLSGFIVDVWVRRITLLAAIACPFVIEYFALFRGYGIGLTCFMWALWWTIRTVGDPRPRHAWFMTLGMAGATLANLTYLTLWAIMAGICVAALLAHKRTATFLWACGALLLVQSIGLGAAASLAGHYAALGQLDFGHGTGFVAGTMTELADHMFGGGGRAVVQGLMIVVLGATALALHRAWKERTWKDPLLICIAIWWLEIIGRSVMHLVLDVMPPPARSALYMVPLALFIIAYTLDRLATKVPASKWAIVVLLILPLRTISDAGLDHVTGSRGQAVPPRFAERAVDMQEALGRPVMVGVHGTAHAAWNYQLARTGHTVNDGQLNMYDHDQDLRLVHITDNVLLTPQYRLVDAVERDGLQLWERTPLMDLALVLDTVLQDRTMEGEFLGIITLDERFPEAVWVRVDGTLGTTSKTMDVEFVASEDSAGTSLSYDDTKLRHDIRIRQGGRFDLMRTLPATRGATRRTVYFWDPAHTHVRLTDARLRIYRMADARVRSTVDTAADRSRGFTLSDEFGQPRSTPASAP